MTHDAAIDAAINGAAGDAHAVNRSWIEPAGGSAIRVMLVDDSVTVRSVLSRLIDAEPDMTVVHKTGSAELALRELRQTPVDIVLLDLEMPGIGGLAALPEILGAQTKLQVCVVSSLAGNGAEHTLRALAMGAADTMLKPAPGQFDDTYRTALLTKIRALGQPDREWRAAETPPNHAPSPAQALHRRPKVIAIGASTGGIHASCEFLKALPDHVDLPILVTQHLPLSFVPLFAKQIAAASGRGTSIARHGEPLRDRRIYIAPGDGHLTVHNRDDALIIAISRQPAQTMCMPSVDPMLVSVADAAGGAAVAVILSGMGRDGTHGASVLAEAGGILLAQDRDSSAVWGMPGALARQGLAKILLPPDALGRKVGEIINADPWT